VLDFAYAIHTNVGDRTLKAKIDQTNVGLDTELKSGQTIEIITDENATKDTKIFDKAIFIYKSCLELHFKFCKQVCHFSSLIGLPSP
jgi:hypothetical protein